MTSSDLKDWTYHGVVLEQGPPGSWDDRAIWTGSVIEHEGAFYMLYTALCHDELFQQRIGLAISTDLVHWKKHTSNPVIEADLKWYEDIAPNGKRFWRDPYLVYREEEGCFYAFITAREKEGALDQRGCIALARSEDLMNWDVLPPVCAPRQFFHLEVPQMVFEQGRYYLIFCLAEGDHSKLRQKHPEKATFTGEYYLTSGQFLNGYSLPPHDLLIGKTNQVCYGGKLIKDPKGHWQLLYWLGEDAKGRFIGGLSDPAPVQFLEDGSIWLV